jgi:hypothetical protein
MRHPLHPAAVRRRVPSAAFCVSRLQPLTEPVGEILEGRVAN